MTARDDWVERARAVRIEDEIARRGIKLRGHKPDHCGPCPRCGGYDRFSINIRKQVWHCRHCKPENITGDTIGFVQWIDGIDFKDAIETLVGEEPRRQAHVVMTCSPENDDYEHEQHRIAAWLWNLWQPIVGSIAEKYLRDGRGIACALPATLGFLPARGDYPPAMIVAYSIPGESEPGVLDTPTDVDSVHITRLLPDGSNRQQEDDAKITIGQPLGRPVVLAPINDLLGLAITEGIEDALTVHQATGLGAWAAGPASFLPSLADSVPAYVRAVTIYSHPDQAGQDNAVKLAAALEPRNIEIRIQGFSA
jgi:hypothetical protein